MTPGRLPSVLPPPRIQRPKRISRRLLCERQCQSSLPRPSCRTLTTTATSRNTVEHDPPSGHPEPQPRWSRTPARMTAPVSLKRKDPRNHYEVNNDPAKLDAFYDRFLGPGGKDLLSEEVKWQAVTHKTFDQGRRGFNDRLAFLGKRIVNLQTSLGLLHRKDGTFVDPPDPHAGARSPFQHPVINLLPRLTEKARNEISNARRMALLGGRMGLLPVLRWKPMYAQDLATSGKEQVMAQAVFAIVGAIALQRGGEVANRIVKDRILAELGLR